MACQVRKRDTKQVFNLAGAVAYRVFIYFIQREQDVLFARFLVDDAALVGICANQFIAPPGCVAVLWNELAVVFPAKIQLFKRKLLLCHHLLSTYE